MNLKSELMLQQLHAKMDDLRAEELHAIQETLQKEIENLNQRFDELRMSGRGSA